MGLADTALFDYQLRVHEVLSPTATVASRGCFFLMLYLRMPFTDTLVTMVEHLCSGLRVSQYFQYFNSRHSQTCHFHLDLRLNLTFAICQMQF